MTKKVKKAKKAEVKTPQEEADEQEAWDEAWMPNTEEEMMEYTEEDDPLAYEPETDWL